MPGFSLVLGLSALLLALNVLWPRYRPTPVAVLSFFASWLFGELAGHVAFGELVAAVVLLSCGVARTWVGVVGIGTLLVAVAIEFAALVIGTRARPIVEAALAHLRAGPVPRETADRDWLSILLPFPVRDRRVVRTRNVPYFSEGKNPLYLDVFRERAATAPKLRPVILYVHGGGWSISDKRWEGLPILLRLAAHGWVGFSANYRLSPRATFPDQIVDIKRAIAWVREHAGEYGGDPDTIVIAGGSSGAHLASLAALSACHRAWQPGFEDADTSVSACVASYGIYDLTDVRHARHNPGLAWLLERHVLKLKEADAPERFVEASPERWIRRCAKLPPFLVLHGAADVLLPVATAQTFFAELQRAGSTGSAYIELPWAQHAFEIFPSPRSLAVLEGIERFLEHVRRNRASS